MKYPIIILVGTIVILSAIFLYRLERANNPYYTEICVANTIVGTIFVFVACLPLIIMTL